MTSFSTEPLVDLDDAKAHLNIPATDFSQDAELEGFLEAASVYIQNLTGPIAPQTYTETHSGGGSTICLFNTPVLSVASVVEYVGVTGYTLTQVTLGSAIGAYSFTLDDPGSGILRRRFSGGLVGAFIGGDHNIVVTYTAGVGAVSADIRMAVLQDIAGLFQSSQLGGVAYGNVDAGNAPLNPVGMFPRVSEILSAGSMRLPGIG